MDSPPVLLDWLRTGQRDVYLFGTCLLDLFWPEAGEDAATLLARHGLRWHYPEGQSCCGQPAHTSGQRASALAVARAQLALFPEPWPVLVPSGSCAGMIRQHWPALFKGQPEEGQARDVARRCIELGTFLGTWWPAYRASHPASGLSSANAHEAAPLPAPAGEPGPKACGGGTPRTCRVALHTSCAARREVDMRRHGVALLDSLPAVQRVDHAQEAECCGFGGVFSLKHPDISGAMVQDKLAHLAQAQPDVVVSADAGCLLNLRHAHEALHGRDPARWPAMRFQHLASFLLEQGPSAETADTGTTATALMSTDGGTAPGRP